MAQFQTPIDVANRALQLCDKPVISSFLELSDSSLEMGRAYDKIRLYQLQRNMWTFATRRVFLRPVDNTTCSITFETWAAGTTYKHGYVVNYQNQNWVSLIDSNTGNTPGTAPTSGAAAWEVYFGQQTIDIWSGNTNVTNINSNLPAQYMHGELVYTTPGDGTYKVYVSLIDNNSATPSSVDVWSNKILYSLGDVVSFNGTNYQSRVAFNFGYEPDTSATQWTTTVTNPTVSRSWMQLTSATIAPLAVVYPAGAGPASDLDTKNIYRLPGGFLKPCPDDPKSGEIPWLGAGSGVQMKDWTYEGGYLVSQQVGPIMLRFIADIQDVSKMHPMFCELLAGSLAENVGPILKVTPEVKANIRVHNNIVLGEAREANAIIMSSVTPPDDQYISVRY